MRNRRTQILLLLVLLTAGVLFWASQRLGRSRAGALANERDLALVHRDLTDIAQANAGGPQIAAGQLDSAELTRRMTAAAIDAGVLGNLVDTETGNTARLENSDYNELEIMLRFDKISLRQLTVFFDRLAAIDPGSRVKTVVLSPPDALAAAPSSAVNAGGNEESWTAFVSVAYLMRAPKEGKPR